jgi:hypothetical protein
MSSAQRESLMIGHGYSFCYDSASTARTADGVRSGMRHDFQVRPFKSIRMS